MVTKQIPINDLRRHNDAMSQLLAKAVDRVIARGWYVLGPEVKAFEGEFAAFCGVDHCVAVGNGTDALELALRAVDVGPGDRVATVANAGMYSTTAIRAIGADPVYVDVDPGLMTMDPCALAGALTSRTRAIIVTHLYGQMAEMESLLKVAVRAGVPVVEDCAQSHGAQRHGKCAGTWGDLGCFSFYPTKNLGALGDGGAVTTDSADIAEKVRRLRQYGWAKKYESVLLGGRNSRLDEIQAAVLRAKLPYLPQWNERRRSIAQIYTGSLGHCHLTVPASLGKDYVAHLYVVRTPLRERLGTELIAAGIGTDIHYPIPDHQQECVLKTSPVRWDLPITERCSREVLTLPCFPEMTDDEVKQVVEVVRNTLGKRAGCDR